MRTFLTTIIMAAVITSSSASAITASLSSFSPPPSENVVLLHGLCRTGRSMVKMDHALTQAGYTVGNVSDLSRTAPIQTLADNAIGKAIAECRENGAPKIDFVTHSM